MKKCKVEKRERERETRKGIEQAEMASFKERLAMWEATGSYPPTPEGQAQKLRDAKEKPCYEFLSLFPVPCKHLAKSLGAGAHLTGRTSKFARLPLRFLSTLFFPCPPDTLHNLHNASNYRFIQCTSA